VACSGIGGISRGLTFVLDFAQSLSGVDHHAPVCRAGFFSSTSGCGPTFLVFRLVSPGCERGAKRNAIVADCRPGVLDREGRRGYQMYSTFCERYSRTNLIEARPFLGIRAFLDRE